MPLAPATVYPVRSPRQRFLGNLRDALRDTRLIWLPRQEDALYSEDQSNFRATVTMESSVASRLATLGNGVAVSFNGTTNYGSVPDADRYSFGTGTADLPFSVVAVVNVTDTAAQRWIITKRGAAGAREWTFGVQTGDTLSFGTVDDSAGAGSSRNSSATITQGTWRVFGFSYDGSGGATNQNGTTLYDQGAVLTSAATNSGTYVAMENLGAVLEIGAQVPAALSPFSGSMALVALTGVQLTDGEHATIYTLCRRFFGI